VSDPVSSNSDIASSDAAKSAALATLPERSAPGDVISGGRTSPAADGCGDLRSHQTLCDHSV